MISQQKSVLGPKRAIHRTQRTSLRRNKRSSKPINVCGEYSEQILPIDLIIEVFSRLPAKSIARFRCLSKFWASRLSHPYFTELFLTRSSSHPQLLFTSSRKGSELLFYSIPQLKNLVSVMATCVMKTRLGHVCHSNGLVFVKQNQRKREFFSMVCNPITGKSLTIPKLSWMSWRKDCYLGYDPIGKQYKLLSMHLKAYKVLTLGSDKLRWRNIKCGREHRFRSYQICIGGVLYYKAYVEVNGVVMIVSFDISSEEFQFMEVTAKFCEGRTLINYNGKLATYMFDLNCQILEIWVLEDPKKHEWSKCIHVMPPIFDYATYVHNFIDIAGVISTDEIVFHPVRESNGSIYVYYYNMKKRSHVKVEIQGIEEGTCIKMPWIFINHVDNLKLLF